MPATGEGAVNAETDSCQFRTMAVTLTVNGQRRTLSAEPDTPLLYVLRGELGLNGAKYGCGLGQCGACTVLKGGQPLRSCIARIGQLEGAEITTLEGLAAGGQLHPLQRAFLDEQAGQCAYCIPGMVMTAVALLKARPDPTVPEIQAALDANLCRCGSHDRIVKAVQRAARGGA
jgi:nicotinate dehydrogenase subunit A